MSKTPTPKQAAGKKPRTVSQKIMSFLRTSHFAKFAVLWMVPYMVLLSFFFANVLKSYNYIEIFPIELIFPALMHAVTALFIALSMYWLPWLKSFAARLLGALILALFMIGYDDKLVAAAGVVRAFIPGVTESDPMPLISLLYLLMLFGFAVLVGVGYEHAAKKFKQPPHRNLVLGIVIVVGYVFVVPAFSVLTALPVLLRQSQVSLPEFDAPPNTSPQSKPDIYYLVFDRYASNEVLKEQFAHDNTPFASFLQSNGFFVKTEAFSNYPYTAMSIASTLNANYLNTAVEPFRADTLQSRTLYHNLVHQSSVARALKGAGYEYHSIGSNYGTSYEAPLAKHDYMFEHAVTVFGKVKHVRGIEGAEFVQSPYYRFAMVDAPWWPLRLEERNAIDYVKVQLNTLDKLAEEPQPGGRFIFAHILVPHDPYYFNADGSIASRYGNDSTGKPIKQKYVGQVQFINNQIRATIEQIQRQSKGEAVVILNADEGPYPQVLNDTFKQSALASAGISGDGVLQGDMRQWPDEWLRMKFGIQQAVHIPRATPADLAQLSSVNVFRIILNRYAGYELPYLPQCHFALNRGGLYEYNFSDITSRLRSGAAASCAELESVHGDR